MNIQDLISTYGSPIYAVAIFFGGRWGLKYFSYFKKDRYNFLVFATVAAFAFLLIEISIGTFQPLHAIGYLITYFIVTSCYEMVADWFPFLKPKKNESALSSSFEDDRDFVQYPIKFDFPVPGAANTVYLDASTDICYVWDNQHSTYRVEGDRPPKPPRIP